MLVLYSDVGCAGRNRISNRPAELLELHNYIYISINMFCIRLIIYCVAGIINRGLTYVHVHVVPKTEGRTSGDTTATTATQLRRSDRGGLPYDILMPLHDYFRTCGTEVVGACTLKGLLAM